MGRKSALSDKQWEEVGRRIYAGEKPASLAREFGIDRSAITRRFAQQVKSVKSVVNQVVAADAAFRDLPVAQQVTAMGLIEKLKSISSHMASAAEKSAASAHRLATWANDALERVDDTDPAGTDSRMHMVAHAELQRVANQASELPLGLLKANKEAIDAANSSEQDFATIERRAAGPVYKIVSK